MVPGPLQLNRSWYDPLVTSHEYTLVSGGLPAVVWVSRSTVSRSNMEESPPPVVGSIYSPADIYTILVEPSRGTQLSLSLLLVDFLFSKIGGKNAALFNFKTGI